MKHLADVIHSHTGWAQPRVLERAWELRQGDDLVVMMHQDSAATAAIIG